MNDMDYECISINYDYILCHHLIACTEFNYLLTPDNYDRLFPVVQESTLPAERPVRKVTLVLRISFDGTGNNAVNTRNMLEALTAQHFNVENPDAQGILARNAQEEMGISGVGAINYLGYYTNIHWLNELYERKFPPEGRHVQSAVYVEGVSTRTGEPDNPIGLGLGTAETGIIAKTDDMVIQLTTAIGAMLALLKRAFVVDTLLLDIFSSSRGTAAARHFANHIQAEDQTIINAISTGIMEYKYRDAPAGNTHFLGIMGTVAAVGTVTNGLDLHSTDAGSVTLRLRPGMTQKVSHLTAQNERRYSFALNSVTPTQSELVLPGMHSDIGDSYMPQLREDLFLTRPQVRTLPQDQPGMQSHIYAQTMAQLRVFKHSSVIMPIIHTHEITPEIWEDPQASTDHYTQPQKCIFTALTLRQWTVFSNWSKVALRVMVDAAVEAGTLLADVDKVQRHALLDAPKPLCEQAREIGKAARQHRGTADFTPEEVDRITDRYVHCSAHWNTMGLKQSGELQDGASVSETVSFVNRPNASQIRTTYNTDGNRR